MIFEDDSHIYRIAYEAFSYNDGLNSITLPMLANNQVLFDENGNTYESGDEITDFDTRYRVLSPQGQYTLILNDVEFDASTGTIKDYTNNTEKDIIIPSELDGVVVTAIGDWAFFSSYPTALTSVIIPSSVTTIGARAFENNNLTSITIPESVTTIGAKAFNRNKIQTINGKASKGIIYARNSDGSDNLSTIVSYGGEATVIDFIPSSVTTIGARAFHENELTSVTIPSSVTTIEEQAFMGNDLTSVTIPSSVTNIGRNAFVFNSLTSVIFEDDSHIYRIATGAFYYNNELNSITLPTLANNQVLVDESGNTYQSGDAIKKFYTSYSVLCVVSFVDHNGTVLKEETVDYGSSATAPVDPTRTGYTFTGWDVDFSNITSDLTVVAEYSIVTNIGETEDNNIKLYPNPASDVITIEHGLLADNITIFNAAGSMVLQAKLSGESSHLSIAELSSGIYMVRIGSKVQRLVIK